jgi:hypothetical protein
MSGEDPLDKPHWREFEELAADIQRQLAPDARVTPDARLHGNRTQAERQIDIMVEQCIGQYPILVVIDCKDYKVPVDVKEVEAFENLVKDVGAHKGAIIAAHGFTATARQLAKVAGIDTYTLVDTKSARWPAYITVPCVFRDTAIERLGFRFQSPQPLTMEGTKPKLLPLFRADGTMIDYLINLVIDRWEAGDIPAVPGEHKQIRATNEETFVKVAGNLQPVTVEIDALVAERLYFGQLSVDQVRGFSDAQTGNIKTNAFTSIPFDIADLEKSWERIDSIEQLSVKPLLTLPVKTFMARYNGRACSS